jgi:hypothetical protein
MFWRTSWSRVPSQNASALGVVVAERLRGDALELGVGRSAMAAQAGAERLQRLEQGRDQLAHRRMDVHRALDHLVREVAGHRREQQVDDLVALDAEQRGAEDALGLGVDEHLHEALRLAALAGPADRVIGIVPTSAGLPRPHLGLAHADAPSGGSMKSA